MFSSIQHTQTKVSQFFNSFFQQATVPTTPLTFNEQLKQNLKQIYDYQTELSKFNKPISQQLAENEKLIRQSDRTGSFSIYAMMFVMGLFSNLNLVCEQDAKPMGDSPCENASIVGSYLKIVTPIIIFIGMNSLANLSSVGNEKKALEAYLALYQKTKVMIKNVEDRFLQLSRDQLISLVNETDLTTSDHRGNVSLKYSWNGELVLNPYAVRPRPLTAAQSAIVDYHAYHQAHGRNEVLPIGFSAELNKEHLDYMLALDLALDAPLRSENQLASMRLSRKV